MKPGQLRRSITGEESFLHFSFIHWKAVREEDAFERFEMISRSEASVRKVVGSGIVASTLAWSIWSVTQWTSAAQPIGLSSLLLGMGLMLLRMGQQSQ